MRTERVAFALDGRPTTIAEVFASAHLGGWIWASLVVPVMEGLACRARAERTGVEVPPVELEAALAAWHVDNKLKTPEEAAAALAFHELDVEDLGEYLARKVLRARFAAEIEDALAEAMIAPDEVIARVPEEAALNGSLPAVLNEAALRMATGAGRSDTTRRAAERRKLVKEHDLTKPGVREAMARTFGVAPDVVDWLVDLEAGYRARVRDVAREDALPRELDAARGPLTTVEFAWAVFDTEGAARAAIADPASVTWETEHALAAGLASQQARAFVADAKVGEVTGPRQRGEKWIVHRVLGRREPRLTDARVRRAVEKRLIDRALGPEVTRRITWEKF